MTSTLEPTGGRDLLTRAALAQLRESEGGPGAVSLRAIARRAGLSHNAATHHFGDRAGLFTAVAVVGFRRLETALSEGAAAAVASGQDPFAGLGRAYLDFGLAEPNLLDLMFRTDLLRRDDAELQAAERATFGTLTGVMSDGGRPAGAPEDLAMVAWAFVHGLASLARYGALGPGLALGSEAAVRARVGEVMRTFGGLFAVAAGRAAASPASS